jgi:hypothetical protein
MILELKSHGILVIPIEVRATHAKKQPSSSILY